MGYQWESAYDDGEEDKYLLYQVVSSIVKPIQRILTTVYFRFEFIVSYN